MSVSAVAPTPFYQDPDRLQIGMPQAVADDAAGTGETKQLPMFAEGEDSPSFWDVLDIINPLQHIPIVSDIYQELTGDKIGVAARVAGGTLFGGPVGLIASLVDCSIEQSTGKDAGGHVLALFKDDESTVPGEAPATMLAAADAASENTGSNAAVAQKPVEMAAADAALVIGLPESGDPATGSVVTGRTAIYSLDGSSALSAPAAQPVPSVSAAQPPAALAAQAIPAVAASPIARPARLMPVPARTNVDPRNAPQVTVPVSSSMNRSTVPLTGHVSDTATTTQRVAASQGVPADATGQTAASTDWFTSAWSEALDKYQRANSRNDALTGSQTVN